MPTGTITVNMNIAGVSFAKTVTRTTDGNIAATASVPKARAGTLTTRTDNDTGVITVASGHGITTSDTVHVAFTAGARIGMTVTAVTSTTISVDAGTGTNLPSLNDAVTVSKEVTVAIAFDADECQLVGFMLDKTGKMLFYDDSSVLAFTYDAVANEPIVSWNTATKDTMPEVFDATVLSTAKCINLDTASDATFYFGAMYDATP